MDNILHGGLHKRKAEEVITLKLLLEFTIRKDQVCLLVLLEILIGSLFMEYYLFTIYTWFGIYWFGCIIFTI